MYVKERHRHRERQGRYRERHKQRQKEEDSAAVILTKYVVPEILRVWCVHEKFRKI